MHSERQVIVFLAFLSIILTFGIDSVLPAFDEIREQFELKPGSGEVSLVITWYLLGMAAGQLLWGLLSDRFGRRSILVVGLGLYGLGALGAGLAPNMTGLLTMRFVWGLGAASPSATRLAIARDLYSGDQMARVVSFVMAVFLLGPAITPAVGEGILLIGDWRLVCFSAAPLAALAVFWSVRFGETLPRSSRRPIDLGATGRGIRAVLLTRVTIGYTLALMFTFGAFFVYLGSKCSHHRRDLRSRQILRTHFRGFRPVLRRRSLDQRTVHPTLRRRWRLDDGIAWSTGHLCRIHPSGL